MKAPQQHTSSNVKAADVPRRHLSSKRDVVHLRSHNDYVAADDRWRGDAVKLSLHGPAKSLRQVYASVRAKASDGFARHRVKTDQIAITSAVHDATILAIGPVSNSAMHEAIIRRHAVLP